MPGSPPGPPILGGIAGTSPAAPPGALAACRGPAFPTCPAAYPCNAGGPIAHVPAGIRFFSPFSSLDLRLRKDLHLGEHVTLGLIGEGFNLFNQVNIRGNNNANFSGRNIAISPLTVGAPVQTNFYQAVTTAGGFFGSGGPRTFQFAARLEF